MRFMSRNTIPGEQSWGKRGTREDSRPDSTIKADEDVLLTVRTTLTAYPVTGSRHELFRIPSRVGGVVNFTVSPEGSRIVMTGDDPQDRIEIRSLTGNIESRIALKGWPDPGSIDWAADGKSVFVTHPGLVESPSGPIGTTLLRVDLRGHIKPIWETRGGRYAWGIASPDGKSIAIREPATERNA